MKLYSNKKYDHKAIESVWNDFWKSNNFFEPKNSKKIMRFFSILLPPPNVTGHLHLGHAWNTTIQDTIARYKRLNGFNVVWVPGVDHAGISTQTKFDSLLKEKKLDRNLLSRDEYLFKLNEWILDQKKYIHQQWGKLGLSLSYKNECYTFDETAKKLTNQIFIKLYKNHLIYQGLKLVNWDCKLQTAISDIEVIFKQVDSKLYFFKYFLNKKDYLTIATTRPETMFGDTNIFVNPNDKRYKKYVGMKVFNPVNNCLLPILADDYIDKNFGTGVMKCTPAHDFNDYQLAIKHNIKNFISVMNYDGSLNKLCKIGNISFENLDRFVAREKIVDILRKKGLLVKIEKYKTNIGFSERSNTIIEPLLSNQWFVRMKKICNDLKNNLSKNELNIIPKNFKKLLSRWLNITTDWCISRQIIWGHQMPVYYDKQNKVYVGLNPKKGYKQINDVLDTWFTSGLWPIIAFIENKKINSANYFPISLLVTAYDILFFWIARMLFQCNFLIGKIPFKTILIHGLIRDPHGKKMSKSLGNGIDPNDLINKFGADALRLFLISSSSLGEDLRYSEEKITYAKNFLNKIWNAHNYLIQYKKILNSKITHPLNIWICQKFNIFLKKYIDLFDHYNFSVLSKNTINFIWEFFCNTYLELIRFILKNEKYKKETIYTLHLIFKNILIILHPICPFITENIYQIFNYGNKSIMLESISELNISFDKKNQILIMDKIAEIIKKVRELRIKHSIKSDKEIKINIIDKFLIKEHDFIRDFLLNFNIKLLSISNKQSSNEYKTIVLGDMIIEYHEDFINEKEIIRKLLLEKKFYQNEIMRSENILNNKNFLLKAPKEKVIEEKKKYEKYKKAYENVCNSLKEKN